jgi:stage II sporulation protein R
LLLQNWENIENTAEKTLAEQGYTYPIRLEYGYFPFPVKYYGSFSLPAGTYEAMRVIIGDGKGSNWWCVLFPPMCFVDSRQIDNDHYTENMPDEKIVFKWRTGEWWNKLMTILDDNDISADCL